MLWCLKWSHHGCQFLNWTEHRLLILQRDLVTGQNPDHFYQHEEQNDLGFLLKAASNNLSCNVRMYEDTALHINRMKKKEDIAMQTGNLLRKTKPNCIFITWLWHHHWRNHYSNDVIRVTRSSTDLYLYYFIIKCNLFIKILQRGKNTKNMKFVQNYKFPKIFRCFQQNSHCQTSESCRTLKISQNISNR